MGDKTGSNISYLKLIFFVIVCIGVFWGINEYTNTTTTESKPAINGPAFIPTVSLAPVEQYDASNEESEFVGRVEAIQTVSLRPQVSGEISKVHFKEGSEVKSGQLLYEINPRRYQATVQLRKAELEQAKANLVTAEKYYNRTKKANDRAVSATDKETAEGNYLQAKAAVAQAEANLKLAEIELDYCKIRSPITGKIGKSNYTKGNYVTPSVDSLATIVQMNPIRVKYSLTDREYLNQLSLFKQDGSIFHTRIKLSNGEDYEANGKREFEDNTIDTATGTVTINLSYENKEGKLIPGEMVRVYTKGTESQIVNVVPQIAVISDSQGDYVYVVSSDHKARERRVKLGREFGVYREAEGVEPGEEVAVSGIQNLRDGSNVVINRPANTEAK